MLRKSQGISTGKALRGLKPELRKKVKRAIIIRQKKSWRRREGIFVHFEDNAAVLVTQKNEMEGKAITGPVAKECADNWPKIGAIAPYASRLSYVPQKK